MWRYLRFSPPGAEDFQCPSNRHATGLFVFACRVHSWGPAQVSGDTPARVPGQTPLEVHSSAHYHEVLMHTDSILSRLELEPSQEVVYSGALFHPP